MDDIRVEVKIEAETLRTTAKTEGDTCPLCGKDKKDWFWPSKKGYSLVDHPRCGCEVYLECDFSEAFQLFWLDRGIPCASNVKNIHELMQSMEFDNDYRPD